MKSVYLDWAASAPVSKKAQRAFIEAVSEFGNPGSPHAAGVRARDILESSRKSIARLAGVKTDGVIFTSGATEANNLAIQGYIQARAKAGHTLTKMHILYLPTAHASVVESIESLARHGIAAELIALKDGAIDLQAFKKQFRSETVLVCVDVVCGETGTRWDVRDVRRVINEVVKERGDVNSNHIALHADASQMPFTEPLEYTHLGADLLTLDAQKIGGVRGIGALLRTANRIPLTPLMYGGGQEFGLRAGTENPALAKAFAAALQECEEGREAFVSGAQSARDAFLATITHAIPDAVVNVGKEFAPHIINLSFPNRDTDYLVMLLSNAGYDVSTKSACETDAEGSGAVLALTNDATLAESTLRISWGPSTSNKELENFVKVLISQINFLDNHKL